MNLPAGRSNRNGSANPLQRLKPRRNPNIKAGKDHCAAGDDGSGVFNSGQPSHPTHRAAGNPATAPSNM